MLCRRSIHTYQEENTIPTSQGNSTQASVIDSLYIQAVRQGQSCEFRVASDSMNPTLRTDDRVHIEPAKANEILAGEIAAFETLSGLVIHRIVQRQQTGTTVRLLEMADVELYASWVEEQAIIGRVVATRRGQLQIDLRSPVANLSASVTAHLRYWFYQLHRCKNWSILRPIISKCSRLAVYICYWCIRSTCTSAVHQSRP